VACFIFEILPLQKVIHYINFFLLLTEKKLLAFFLLFISLIGKSQPLSIQWQKCLGGTLGDGGYSIIQTQDGGFLSAGIAISNDGDVSGNHAVNHLDYWVVKMNSIGQLEWQKCYGGSGEDYLYDIIGEREDGFVLSGIGGSTDGDIIGMHGPGDFWILKCDSVGNILWQKCLGGSDEEVENNAIKCYDNGYAAIGWTVSSDFDVVGRHDSSLCPTCADTWVVKLDSNGLLEWSKCYGGSYAEGGYSIIQTIDSGFVFASSAMSDNGDVQGIHGGIAGLGGDEDYWIIKTDYAGNMQWQKCLGGSAVDVPSEIIQTSDKGFVITGSTHSSDYDVVGYHGTFYTDAWIVKIDSSGNIQWQRSLGGSGADVGNRIIQLSDGGYLALCNTSSTDGDLLSNPPNGYDEWLVRLDNSGNILWQQCFGGSYSEVGSDLKLTSDGGFITSGLTNSNDGDVSGNHGDVDMWVLKFGNIPDNINSSSNSTFDFNARLENENLYITISSDRNSKAAFQLCDVFGRKLINEQMNIHPGINQFSYNLFGIKKGIYFIIIDNHSKKFLIE
jgi:hypothetical protein